MTIISFILNKNEWFELKPSDYDFYLFWISLIFIFLSFIVPLIIIHTRVFNFTKLKSLIIFIFKKSKNMDEKLYEEELSKIHNNLEKSWDDEPFKKQRLKYLILSLFFFILFTGLNPIQQKLPLKDKNMSIKILENNQLKILKRESGGLIIGKGIVSDCKEKDSKDCLIIDCEERSLKNCLTHNNL